MQTIPVKYISDRAIMIFAYNRYKYLKVCLDSMYKIPNIMDYDLCIFIDGGQGPEERTKMCEVIAQYPVTLTYIHKDNLGCRNNMLYGLRTLFTLGAKEVAYFEEDHLVRPDIMEYFDKAPRDHTFVNAGMAGDTTRSYAPIGNLITKDNFWPLYDWIEGGGFVGKARPEHPDQILTEESKTHDAVFFLYIVEHELRSRLADKCYVLHCGLSGWNRLNPSAVTLAYEQLFFSGPPDKWLSNIVKLYNNDAIPPEIKKRMMPSGNIFTYPLEVLL